jgi:hypothetical protein
MLLVAHVMIRNTSAKEQSREVDMMGPHTGLAFFLRAFSAFCSSASSS